MVPLSPQEEEQLRLIEQQLHADRGLMKAASDPFRVRTRMALGVLGMLVGLGLLVFAVTLENVAASVITGIVAFVFTLANTFLVWRAYRQTKDTDRLFVA